MGFPILVGWHLYIESAPCRGSGNRRPIVRNAILTLSDKWLSLDTRPMDEQITIAPMSFIHMGQADIWFRTSADAMLLVRRTSASQISQQSLPLVTPSLPSCRMGWHYVTPSDSPAWYGKTAVSHHWFEVILDQWWLIVNWTFQWNLIKIQIS